MDQEKFEEVLKLIEEQQEQEKKLEDLKQRISDLLSSFSSEPFLHNGVYFQVRGRQNKSTGKKTYFLSTSDVPFGSWRKKT